MEPTQQPIVSDSTTPVTPTSPAMPGMFGTKIPATVAFTVGVLLFFMPFMEIKCGNNTLQQVSGFQMATGFNVKKNNSGNSLMDDFNTGKSERNIPKSEKKDPNMFALIALGLGVIGLLLSFAKARGVLGVAMITGLLSAVALIGLMIDVKKQVKLEMPGQSGGDDNNLLKGMNGFGDNMGISVVFTSWFYIAVIAFLAAAFFCYMRLRSNKA